MPGSDKMADWRWLYTADVSGPYEAFTYIQWGSLEPNNQHGTQNFIRLHVGKDYLFTDCDAEYAETVGMCYICECQTSLH